MIHRHQALCFEKPLAFVGYIKVERIDWLSIPSKILHIKQTHIPGCLVFTALPIHEQEKSTSFLLYTRDLRLDKVVSESFDWL